MLLWIVTVTVVVAAAGVAAYHLSPWPRALLIRYSFEKDAARTKRALEKHVPPGVASVHDVRYDPADRDARLDVYYPAGIEGTETTLPTIVWIHGGAWISCSKEAVANYLKILAGHGYAVVAVGYSIAPAATYPTPLKQVLAALAYLDRSGAPLHLDRDRLILAGDSAGAQVAAQIANLLTDPIYAARVGLKPTVAPTQLRGALLFCGAYDVDLLDFEGAHGRFLKTVMWSYSGYRDPTRHPDFDTFSVARHVTPAFPPAFVSVGNDDPLAPQSHALAAALRVSGVSVDTLLFPADGHPPVPHQHQFDLDSDAGRAALARALAFLQRHTDPLGETAAPPQPPIAADAALSRAPRAPPAAARRPAPPTRRRAATP